MKVHFSKKSGVPLQMDMEMIEHDLLMKTSSVQQMCKGLESEQTLL